MFDLDLSQFTPAYVGGLPNVGFLRCMHRLQAWSDLPLTEAVAALQAQTEDQPRLIYQCLVVLSFKIQRELGIPMGPEAGARLQQVFSEVQQGTAPEDQRQRFARLSTVWQLAASLKQGDPTLGQPVSAADTAKAELQEATTAILDRLLRRT
ncbi:MAG: hypothetical protein ABI273_11740, partial [Lacunisphaera sp.]